MNNPNSYLEHEKQLNSNQVNRAAALFPYWVGLGNETFLVFQNYWQWKREVDVTMRLNIYNNNGEKINYFEEALDKNSYEIKVSNFIKNKLKKIITGMIEIEIISNKNENIVFPFPAIMVFYTNGKGEFSGVHSAGRTLLFEDDQILDFDETNFYCKLNTNFSPFIHLFTGKNSYLKNLSLSIFSTDNELITRICLKDIVGDFKSKTLYLDDILSEDITERLLKYSRFFLRINGKAKGVYPRFIVVNFSRNNNMLYVTHSFRSVLKNDFYPIDQLGDNDYISSIAIMTPPDISLRSSIYPTCGPSGQVHFEKFKVQDNHSNLYKRKKEELTIDIGLQNGALMSACLKGNQSAGFLSKKSKNVPSRINCGLEFFSKKSHHPTDIALQFRLIHNKKKFNFWGHFVNIDNFTTYLLISNFFADINQVDAQLILKIGNEHTYCYQQEVNIKAGECLSLNLNEQFKKISKEIISENSFLPWRIEVTNGQIQDIYIVSHNKISGAIFGDHSF